MARGRHAGRVPAVVSIISPNSIILDREIFFPEKTLFTRNGSSQSRSRATAHGGTHSFLGKVEAAQNFRITVGEMAVLRGKQDSGALSNRKSNLDEVQGNINQFEIIPQVLTRHV
jgi:hypothetical protein